MDLDAQSAENLARLMQGMSAPSRLMLLARLDDAPCSVGTLVEATGISQATVSNHLRTLRHLNLVVGHREGKNVIYALADEHVRTFLHQVVGHLRHPADPGDQGAVHETWSVTPPIA